jgi:ABC-type enterochelin transport system substrate-binding protein
MNWKLFAVAICFSGMIVACSKQDNKAAQQKPKTEANASASLDDCKKMKDEEERNKCVNDNLFGFDTTPPVSRPATSY